MSEVEGSRNPHVFDMKLNNDTVYLVGEDPTCGGE